MTFPAVVLSPFMSDEIYIGDARYAAGHLRGARTAWEEALTILDDLHHPDARRVRGMLNELGTGPPT